MELCELIELLCSYLCDILIGIMELFFDKKRLRIYRNSCI